MPKSVTAGLDCGLGRSPAVSDDNVAEAAYVTIVALQKWILPLPVLPFNHNNGVSNSDFDLSTEVRRNPVDRCMPIISQKFIQHGKARKYI